MKKFIGYVSIIVLIVVLAACGADNNKDKVENKGPSISEEEKVAEDKIVVTVNGDEVLGITYNLVYAQLKLHAEQFEKEVTQDEIKDLTIDSLIDRQILMQQAEKDGLLVSDEEAAEELKRLKEESGAAFDTLLEQYQLTEKEFENQLKFELTMNEFLKEEIKVTVSKDEIKTYYEKAKAENDDIPELVEIHDTLKGRIEQEKIQEALQVRIDEIKENATIEVNI